MNPNNFQIELFEDPLYHEVAIMVWVMGIVYALGWPEDRVEANLFIIEGSLKWNSRIRLICSYSSWFGDIQ